MAETAQKTENDACGESAAARAARYLDLWERSVHLSSVKGPILPAHILGESDKTT